MHRFQLLLFGHLDLRRVAAVLLENVAPPHVPVLYIHIEELLLVELYNVALVALNSVSSAPTASLDIREKTSVTGLLPGKAMAISVPTFVKCDASLGWFGPNGPGLLRCPGVTVLAADTFHHLTITASRILESPE